MNRPRLRPALTLRRLRRPPRFGRLSFNRMLPNLLTMVGLCAGLTAIRFALDDRFAAAAGAIVVAGCIDGLDGRLARLLKATSRFGAEFDSLADFLCFGTAPALVLYLWSLRRYGGHGYLPCLMFAVCMALRLARFSAAIEAPARGAYTRHFFTGVPAPAGAGIVLLPLFVGLEAEAKHLPWLEAAARSAPVCATALVATAALLVSTLPVWNFKHVRLPPAWVRPLLLGTGLYVALLVADPWAALAAAGLLYLGMLPFSRADHRRLRALAEQPEQIPPLPGGNPEVSQ